MDWIIKDLRDKRDDAIERQEFGEAADYREALKRLEAASESSEETRIRRVIREELDRRPEGFEKYQAACVAYFDYWSANTMEHWSEAESCRLFDEALKARPAHVQ